MRRTNDGTQLLADDVAKFSFTLLNTGDPRQIAASSSEGLAVLVATALLGRCCPSCGDALLQKDGVRMLHRVFAAMRGETAPRRFA